MRLDFNFFKDKNILVTGASGFIGTNLVEKFAKNNIKIKGTYFNHKPSYIHQNIEYIKADLTNREICQSISEEIDYIFMCAANSSGAAVMEKTPLAHLTPNLIMNAYMLEAAYAQNVSKFCFISSNTVYPVTEDAVSENDANYNFFEKYFIVGWMKQFSEVMCDMYSSKIKKPMNTMVIRPGNLYGPYDKYTWNESKVVAALIRRAVEKQNPFEVWGDGLQTRSFLFVEDCVTATTRLMRSEFRGPVNIGSEEMISINDLSKLVIGVSGKRLSIDNIPGPQGVRGRNSDNRLIEEKLGWSPSYTLKQGLEATYPWISGLVHAAS